MRRDEESKGVWKAPPERLARLFDLAAEAPPPWGADELRAVLQDLLDAPLAYDLTTLPVATARSLKALSSTRGLLLNTCGQLLRHAKPPLELLRLLKDFGKANIGQRESPLPEPVAQVLYYASVASAWLHLNLRISELADSEFQAGMRWGLAQEWLDADTRDLFEQTLSKLASPQTNGSPNAHE